MHSTAQTRASNVLGYLPRFFCFSLSQSLLGSSPRSSSLSVHGSTVSHGRELLSEDQLLRKAWTAWMEAIYESKQNEISDAVPKIQEKLL